MSVDQEETWEERYAREDREYAAKVAKTWAKYKDRKDGKRESRDGGQYTLTFPDSRSDTEKQISVRETTFTFDKGEKAPKYAHKYSSTRQKFLVVNGPLAGKRVTPSEDYFLYNASSRDWNKSGRPQCVLVHRSSFK